MVGIISEKPEIATEESTSAARPNRILRSSRFKYYIHDGIEACRLQLVGELTEVDVPELSGCWRTAKTTLGKRKLIIDLLDLKHLDEAGAKWLTTMVDEGAHCVPGAAFARGVWLPAASNSAPVEHTRKPGRFGRLLSMFRGVRAPSAESSTQAQ